MNHGKWTFIVDITTVLWLVIFSIGFLTHNSGIQTVCELLVLGLLPIFIYDLMVLMKHEDNFRSFIKKRWFDVLLVIPYFRIFRILRFARLLKLMKLLKLKKILGLTRFSKKAKRTTQTVRNMKLKPNQGMDPTR